MTSTANHSHKILDGRAMARINEGSLGPVVKDLAAAGWQPKLVSITVGDADATKLYVRNQRRAADRIGVLFEERNYPAEIGPEELQGVIMGLNANPRVTGIIIQRPVPAKIPIKTLQRAVSPLKDVEGMHPASIGNIVYNDLVMGPCTAVAAVNLLKGTRQNLQGMEVVVIGHSEIVGKPIAFLLMSEGATVTVCHHMTRNLSSHSRRADAVFVAVGKAGLVTGDMLKPGATVIDIGINQINAADGSSKVVGDADFASCLEVAGWITPVPGGVGPVTVSTLMQNAVVAARLQKDAYDLALSGRLEGGVPGH